MRFKKPIIDINYFLVKFLQTNEIIKDPAQSLLRKNQEFNFVLDNETDYIYYIKYIFFNRKAIFAILFDEENKIDIKITINRDMDFKKVIAFLFYLCLLIEENKDMVYFTYSDDLIKDIKTIFLDNINKNKTYINIILSKILIVLINNYIEEKCIYPNLELEEMKSECENIIRDNIENLKEINLNLKLEEILELTIDEIYFNFIFGLINSQKFDNNIYDQIYFEDINIINCNIYSKIYQAVNDRNFRKKYLIRNLEDFNDINKIHAYYILFNYIFKDSMYIYQIPFLLDTRETLIKYIKKNKEDIFTDKNNLLKFKIFIMKKLFDSEYYINKYIEGKIDINNNTNNGINNDNIKKEEIKEEENEIEGIEDIQEILNYYKKYEFESKKNDIDFIETSLKDKKNFDYSKYLKDLDKAKKMNQRYNLIIFLHKKNNPNSLTERELKKSVGSYDSFEKSLKDNKFNKMQVKTSKILYEYFKNRDNKNQLKNIYTEDEIDLFIKYNQLKEVLLYYKHYFFTSNKNEIEALEKIIKEKSFNNNCEKYLNDLKKAEKMNLCYSIIIYLAKEGIKMDNIQEEKINEIALIWEKSVENLICQKKYEELPESLKKLILDFFKDKDNEEYLLKIFTKDVIDFFSNLDIEKIKKEEKIIKKEIINEKNIIINNEINNELQTPLIKPENKSEINLEETAYKTKVLSVIEKYNQNAEIKLENNDEYLLMIDIFKGKNFYDTMNENQYNELLIKYKTLKDVIKTRKKTKLNKKVKVEAFKYFKENDNKEKLLKSFSEDDINFFISLNTNNKKAQIEQIKEEKNLIKLDPEIIKKLNEVKKYYINYYFDKKKDDINAIENILKEQNPKNEEINKYIQEYDTALELNKRISAIQYLFQIRKEENKAKVISDVIESWNKIEDMIKNKKFKKMKERKNYLNFFKDEKNKETLINIFGEEIYNYFKDEKNHSLKIVNAPKSMIISKPNIINQMSEEEINNLSVISTYYKTYCFESKKNEITLLEKAINTKEKMIEKDYNNYLKDIDVAKKMNERYDIIEYIYNINNKENKNKTQDRFDKIVKSFSAFEKAVKDRKTTKLKNDIRKILTELHNQNKDLIKMILIFS